MLKDFILPDLGEGIVACEVLEWKVHEGDYVHEDQVVADLATDKAIVEIPAVFSGRVDHLCYQTGEQARVGQPLYTLQVAANEHDQHDQEHDGSTDPVVQTQVSAPMPESASPSVAPTPQGNTTRVLATPAVRKLARTANIALTEVTGTGKNGRVLKGDVEAFIDAAKRSGRTAETTAASLPVKLPQEQMLDVTAAPPAEKSNLESHVETTRCAQSIALNPIQREMAACMTLAHREIPQFSLMEQVQVDALLDLHQQLRKALPKTAKTPGDLSRKEFSLTALLIQSLLVILKEFPLLNSRLDMTQHCYTPTDTVNIGIAVDTPRGLVVPVLKGVESIPLLALAQSYARLVSQAREGSLAPEDYRGGTITLSNIGPLGGMIGIPIVKPPEVAIVALGRIDQVFLPTKRGKPRARRVMTVCWSADHRLLDGATLTKAMAFWRRLLEAPSQLLLYL